MMSYFLIKILSIFFCFSDCSFSLIESFMTLEGALNGEYDRKLGLLELDVVIAV